jgi:hypothetical protein
MKKKYMQRSAKKCLLPSTVCNKQMKSTVRDYRLINSAIYAYVQPLTGSETECEWTRLLSALMTIS